MDYPPLGNWETCRDGDQMKISISLGYVLLLEIFCANHNRKITPYITSTLQFQHITLIARRIFPKQKYQITMSYPNKSFYPHFAQPGYRLGRIIILDKLIIGYK